MSKKLLLYIALSMIVSAAEVGCNSSTSAAGTAGSATTGSAAQHIAPVPVKVARRDLIGYELLQAKLYVPPEATSNIPVSNTGPVRQVDVKTGDSVKRGQLLVELEDTNIQTDYTNAKETLAAAKSAYATAEVQYGQPVKDAEQQLAQAQSVERDMRTQPATGSTDSPDLHDAQQTREQAQEQLTKARAVEQANMLQYRQQLDEAQKATASARSSAKQGIITAPISGTVTALNVVPGQQVGTSANSSIGTIVDLDAIELKCDLNDSQQSIAGEGTHVVIVFRDIPDRIFDGRIASVRSVPSKDGATLHEATIRFKNTDHLVKPGSMLSRAGIKTGQVQGALTVPFEALHRDGGKWFVNVDVNGSPKPTEVKIGISDGQYTQIKSGLNEGDTVEVTPQ